MAWSSQPLLYLKGWVLYDVRCGALRNTRFISDLFIALASKRETRLATRKAIKTTVPVMRMAHPLAFTGFLRSIGAPVDSSFRRARLPLLCEDPNSYVPVHRVWSFFDDMTARESEALGWEAGRWAHENMLEQGLMRRLETAPTLGRALQDFAVLATAENTHIRLGMTTCDKDVLFWVHNAFDADTPGYHVAQSYSLEVMLAVLRHFVGASWIPEEVGIEALSVPERARAMLPGTWIRAGQKVGYIRFPRVFLSLPPDRKWPSGPDAGNDETTLPIAASLNFSESLGLVLETYLSEGCPSAEKVAALVGTSSRTLKRRLEREGLSYSDLVDRVRYNLARRMLQDSDVKMIEISYALGYSDPSHFARGFRRMTGVSPSDYRHERCG